MRITALLVAIAGCGANDVEGADALQVDAGTQVDAPPAIDGPIARCTPAGSTAPPVATATPSPGTYCVQWNRIDGASGDVAPRYYDRVDIELTGARWYTSDGGGAKEYEVGASVADGCLVADGFDYGFSRSDAVRLCWASTSEAHGVLTWRATGVEPTAHWTLCLAACP